MLLAAMRKAFTNAIGGGRSLFVGFYRKHVYVGEGCVEYVCMEIKNDNEVGKIFFIFSQFSSKCLIELYAMIDKSPKEILVLLCKPRKPRSVEDVIGLMHGSMATSSNEDDKSM